MNTFTSAQKKLLAGVVIILLACGFFVGGSYEYYVGTTKFVGTVSLVDVADQNKVPEGSIVRFTASIDPGSVSLTNTNGGSEYDYLATFSDAPSIILYCSFVDSCSEIFKAYQKTPYTDPDTSAEAALVAPREYEGRVYNRDHFYQGNFPAPGIFTYADDIQGTLPVRAVNLQQSASGKKGSGTVFVCVGVLLALVGGVVVLKAKKNL